MRYILTILLLFFASTAVAATDIVATYKYSDGNMITLVTRDSQHVRMETSPTSYMLLKDDKVYSVSRDDDGQWMVMDMEQMKGLTSGGGFMSMFGGQAAEPKEYTAKYEKTGQKEKIAGYTGIVYNVEMMENGKLVRRDEVVLCSHSDVKKVNQAWAAMSARMGDSMGEEMSKSIEQATKEAQKAGYGGMLRYGDEMKLSSLQKKTLNADYYQLPAGAKSVGMGKMPGGQTRMSVPEPEQPRDLPQSGQESQALEPVDYELDKAEEPAPPVKEEPAADKEDELQKSVKGLLDSLFN